MRENILKLFFKLGEESNDFLRMRNLIELRDQIGGQIVTTGKGLKQLERLGFVSCQGRDIKLTETGLIEAKRIVRLHRLWELYLTKRLNLPSDHVHQDAEAIEHVITPELEELLLKELDYPQRDPHNSQIPV